MTRPRQRLRLLDRPMRRGELPLGILIDYLGDSVRAANLQEDFSRLTIRLFTENWELTESTIETYLMEVEILRARLLIMLARS